MELHLDEMGKQNPLPQWNKSGRLLAQSLSVGRSVGSRHF